MQGLQSFVFWSTIILTSTFLTWTVEAASTRKLTNSTSSKIPHKLRTEVEGKARGGGASRYDDNIFEDEDFFSKEDKSDKKVDKGVRKKESSRNCQGVAAGTTVPTTDLSALAGFGAAGIAEIITAVVVIKAIIIVKAIAVGVIYWFWAGKGDKDNGGGGGYSYGPAKPVYGPPQTQYGVPVTSGYGRSLINSINMEMVGNYVWKAIDYFSELNDAKNSITDANKGKIN